MDIVRGKVSGTGKKAVIVMSRRNEQVVKRLLEGAVGELIRSGMDEMDITVYEVPGSWEIAGCVDKLIKKSMHDMIICLGAVIRGDTPHFEYISSQVARTVAELGLRSEKPVTFGILTCDSLEQAVERSGGKGGNKGEEAARAALEMSDIYEGI
ncbi:MAG: 6,7-dimethyl-8-ribityllumazine synthase [Elusimicrobia bacterium]|nr:6,7-dimethyl-8-ribityllumazine synthase [Elusimicrobiota bacterium]